MADGALYGHVSTEGERNRENRQFAVKAIRPSSRVAFNLSGSLISRATKPNSSTHAIALKQSCRSSKRPSPYGVRLSHRLQPRLVRGSFFEPSGNQAAPNVGCWTMSRGDETLRQHRRENAAKRLKLCS